MVRTGDTVMVITGRDKGKTGKVLRLLKAKNRALVEKLQIVKRHTRPSPQQRQGGIVEKEASIHVSNLMPYCSKCQKPVRVKQEADKKGEKRRVCTKCNEKIGV